MFNIVQKSNAKLIQSFASEAEASKALEAMGPRRNFMKIIEVAEESPARESKPRKDSAEAKRLSIICRILHDNPDGLAMADIKKAYFEAEGFRSDDKKASKAVYETVFQHSDACHNKTWRESKLVFTRSADGIYSIVKS